MQRTTHMNTVSPHSRTRCDLYTSIYHCDTVSITVLICTSGLTLWI